MKISIRLFARVLQVNEHIVHIDMNNVEMHRQNEN